MLLSSFKSSENVATFLNNDLWICVSSGALPVVKLDMYKNSNNAWKELNRITIISMWCHHGYYKKRVKQFSYMYGLEMKKELKNGRSDVGDCYIWSTLIHFESALCSAR